MTTRADFVAEARSWVGVPFRHQGRSRAGVDCVGLLLVTCWALGLTTYNAKGYGSTPDVEFMRSECERLMVRSTEPQIGDVLLVRITKALTHMMIRSEMGAIYSRHMKPGKVVETVLPASWERRIVAAYTVPGVA